MPSIVVCLIVDRDESISSLVTINHLQTRVNCGFAMLFPVSPLPFRSQTVLDIVDACISLSWCLPTYKAPLVCHPRMCPRSATWHHLLSLQSRSHRPCLEGQAHQRTSIASQTAS